MNHECITNIQNEENYSLQYLNLNGVFFGEILD